MLADLKQNDADPARVTAMLQEMVRSTMARMLDDQEAPQGDVAGEGRLEAIRADLAAVKDALRQRDWSAAAMAAGDAGEALGITEFEQPALARQILVTRRRLLEIEVQVEETMDDPLCVGRDLLKDHGLSPSRDSLKPPMLLSEAMERAAAEATSQVEKKIRTVGGLAQSFFGDVTVASLDQVRVLAFLEFLWWLPKEHGKAHGRNRYHKVGKSLCPREEKRKADASDAAHIDAVLADTSLSAPDRRRILNEKLAPRLTNQYVVVLRDMFQRIVKAALGARAVGRDLEDDERVVPTQKLLKQKMAIWEKNAKTPCGLPKRISRPKRRRSWSLEHLSKLLRSPIYTGSSSLKQRTRPAASGERRVVVRDALYWVPLVMVTMGMRPEEVLQLGVANVLRRNDVFCLNVEDRTKTEQSRRFLPIPELLFQLGFLDWVRQVKRIGETWLFPEIPESLSSGSKSQTFGDRMRTKLKTLKIFCHNEDIYAMRRTLSSKLLHGGVDTGVRQRILGHLEGTTVDAHYSDDGLRELKTILDAVDYGITVAYDAKLGFPVITGCGGSLLPPASIEVALQKNGEVGAVCVTSYESDKVFFKARIEGARISPEHELASAQKMPLEEVATRLDHILQSFELPLPADEETTQAIEHMLIFARPGERADAPAGLPEAVKSEDPAVSDASKPSLDVSAGDEVRPRLPYSAGQVVSGYASADGSMRRALVVGTRTLGRRLFLDLAAECAVRAKQGHAHQLWLLTEAEIAAAGLSGAAGFDLRHRMLVEAECSSRSSVVLGRLSAA